MIPTTEGRPERRYCTAAHRSAARQARRAAMQAEQRGLAETLPWLREPVEAPDPAPIRPAESRAASPEPEPAARPPRDRRVPRPRGRALAMLGVAGILAGGYAATEDRSEPSPSVSATPDAETADAWAQRASVALTSVNRELDVLDQAEQEWRRMPERPAAVPAPVAALEQRRSVLQRRRATLQSQLDAYRSLRRAQQDLAVSEQHLRAVEKALADAPPQHRSSEQDAAIAALDEQRDLRIRQRDAQRAELDSLQEGVATATRTPLPDDGAVTTEVIRDVHEMVRNGGTAPTRPPAPTPSRPDVVAGREEDDGKPRQEVGTSGPPDPRGPRDESEERREAAEGGAAKRSATPETPDRDGPETTAAPPADATHDAGPAEEPGSPPKTDSTGPSGDATRDGRAADTSPDTFTELRERVKEVAREARKAEAARRTGGGEARADARGTPDDAGTSRSSEPRRRTDAEPDAGRPLPQARPSQAARDPQPTSAKGRARSERDEDEDEKAQTRTAPVRHAPEPSANHRRPHRDDDPAGRGEKRDRAAGRGEARDSAAGRDEKRDSATRVGTKRHDADEDRPGSRSHMQERKRDAPTADRVAEAPDVVVYVIPHWPIRPTSAEKQSRGKHAGEKRSRDGQSSERKSGERKPAPRRSSERKPDKSAGEDDDAKTSDRERADEDRSDGERRTSDDPTERSGRPGSDHEDDE